MAEEPLNLEMWVLEMIKGAFKSREVWEAERPDHAPPLNDDRTMLQNWASLINRQGMLLAHLSVVPPTRAELITSMSGIIDRSPAWLDAQVQGQQAMTLKLFMRGLAQAMTEQRVAIERVVDEQVADPEPIEEVLAKAPVPAGTEEEERSDLISGVGKAASAHTKALADIAYDLEMQFGRVVIQWEDED
jgi:hypothetical protein